MHIVASVWAALIVLVAPALAAGQAQSPPSVPQRMTEMQHHFSQITRLHEALIRGDIKGLLAPAAELATTDPPAGFPEKAAPYVEAIRESARRAGTAPNLRVAATETVTLANLCADCHRAVGIYPSPASPRRRDLPTVVGHMIDHQRAADDLLQGLVMPSASRWQEAADRLQTASLRSSEWPANLKLTDEARRADIAVHALADRARKATTTSTRTSVYVDLVTTCAGCHSLGRGAYGPRNVQ
jgi:cytochrome c553